MKKDMKIYLGLIVVVILIIAGIYYIKGSGETPEEQTMKCISEQAVLYSQTTCVHCKQQKEILGQYLPLFKIIECDQTPALCPQITGTPTWEIKEKFYGGVKSIKELADLTDCKCNANIDTVKDSSEDCTLEQKDKNCTAPAQTICTK